MTFKFTLYVQDTYDFLKLCGLFLIDNTTECLLLDSNTELIIPWVVEAHFFNAEKTKQVGFRKFAPH